VRFAVALSALSVLCWSHGRDPDATLHVERTFFGVHRVHRRYGPALVDPVRRVRTRVLYDALYHGNTRHGTQALDPRFRRVATSYYHRTGPMGRVFEVLGTGPRLDRVAVVGLGVGTLAAYGRPGQTMTFYEIDPAVVRIASDTRLFTYLAESRAAIELVVGDGRLSLEKAPPGTYGLIVVDAFSSDSIPIHLLTREAVALYLDKLHPRGVLALHVTNLYLDLVPVVEALAFDLGLSGIARADEVTTPQEMLEGKDASSWVLLARDEAALAPLRSAIPGEKLPWAGNADRAPYRWTDGFSNLPTVLKFRISRREARVSEGGASVSPGSEP
jgi:hypothetical protein